MACRDAPVRAGPSCVSLGGPARSPPVARRRREDPYTVEALSPRERAVAALLDAGLTDVQIAGRLGLTLATVAAVVEWITPCQVGADDPVWSR